MVKRDVLELRNDPNDGLPGLPVGEWSLDKHELIQRYVDITSATRAKFLGQGNAGATFIDLFCSYGRAYVRDSNSWIDGSSLVAWYASVKSKRPFSDIYLADINEGARSSCSRRLRALGAPCTEVEGDATSAAHHLLQILNPAALHTVFLDPYGLGTLDFAILRSLSALRRVDVIMHISAMDLQRNLESYMAPGRTELDRFAPGWRNVVQPGGDRTRVRSEILLYWKSLIEGLGVWPSTEMKLITGPGSQRLYWLTLASKHKLGQKFWKIASNTGKQGNLFEPP